MSAPAVPKTTNTRQRAVSQVSGTKSRYVPPSGTEKIMLSKALADTNRFPENPQRWLLPEERPQKARDLKIFYAGDLALLKLPTVAVVGSRDATAATVLRVRKLVKGLVEAGIVVVSGLARGVDTAAHTAAIEMGGRTIAVLGTPLDRASPAENALLQQAIYRDHLLVSQFSAGTVVTRRNFPARNRLMAAISDATVIMQASDTSGTLHQAAECVRLKRWLFIARSVADDDKLSWPKRFISGEKCRILDRVEDVLEAVLGCR